MVHWNSHPQLLPPPTPEGLPQHNIPPHHLPQPPPSHPPAPYRPPPLHYPETPSSPGHGEAIHPPPKRARALNNGSPPPQRLDHHSSPSHSYKPQPRPDSSPMRTARPYTDEAPSAHSPGAHGTPGEVHRRQAQTSPDYQRRRSDMDAHAPPYAATPHTLGEHMREQQMHNVSPPANAYGPHIDTSVGANYGPHSQPHSAPPYPPAPYTYGPYDTPNGIIQDSSQKRKAVRASQACDNCRAKKAKCDENKPCGNCVANNVQCHFRDIQPPKQERSMLQLNDTVSQLTHGFQSIEGRMAEIQNAIMNIGRRLDNSSVAPSNDQGPKDSYYSPPNHLQPVMRPHSPDHNISSAYSDDYQQHAAYGGHAFKAEPIDSKRWNQTDRSPAFASNPPASPQMEDPAQMRDHEMTQDLARRREEAQMDMLNGNVSLAPRHFTAANNLSTWPSISPSFQGVAGQDYVKRGEHHHSLCLRSVLQRAAKAEAGTAGSPATHSEHDDSSSVSNLSDGRPAMAFVKQGSEGSRGSHPTPGGRNPRDQSLSIDKETSHYLLQSYLEKIHVQQPFLGKNNITSLVEQFVSSYCSEPGPPYSPFAVIDSTMERPDSRGAMNNSKRRKYSQGPGNENNQAKSSSPKIPIERRVENAIVLLVFALGKACAHEGPLPALCGESKTIPPGTPVPAGVSCTPAPNSSNGSSRKGSPALVTTSSILGYKKQEDEYYTNSDYRTSDPYSQDIDRVPGLAYYIHAVQILGEIHGDNSLKNVQAQLLAGLYMGQLVRVNDSYKWICSACMTWQMLFKQRDEEVRNTSEEERTTFWACLVLESDIVAEVDCVQSGISKWEDQMRYPRMEEELDVKELNCKVFFLAQIAIRKILNRAHSALHTLEEDKQKNQEWQRLSSQDLTEQLEGWRRGLPTALQWDDNAPLASTINAARLRGKYWGARYVIFRNYLRDILHPDSTPKPHNRRAVTQDDAEWRSQYDKQKEAIARAVQCIEAAKASTVAFDGIPTMRKRLIVTNPFGTAQAQFSNILVLTAAFHASSLRGHVQQYDILQLIARTYEFLENIAHLSPTMNTNLKILDRCKWRVLNEGGGGSAPNSAYNSFNGQPVPSVD